MSLNPYPPPTWIYFDEFPVPTVQVEIQKHKRMKKNGNCKCRKRTKKRNSFKTGV